LRTWDGDGAAQSLRGLFPRDDDLLFSLNAAKRRDSLSISCPSQFSFQPRNFRFQLCLKTYAEGMAAVPTSPGITYMD